ncbi:MAG: hypothetical protein ACNA7O_19625 [Rhodobacterales bacterium]
MRMMIARDYTEYDELEALALVMSALEAKGRIPVRQPASSLPAYFNRDNIEAFYLEQKTCGGWVGNVAFRNIPAGRPDVIGTPEAYPFETQEAAFMAGASIVYEVVTGSRELPFFAGGNQRICAAY